MCPLLVTLHVMVNQRIALILVISSISIARALWYIIYLVLYSFYWQVTHFVAWMALDEKRIRSHRNIVFRIYTQDFCAVCVGERVMIILEGMGEERRESISKALCWSFFFLSDSFEEMDIFHVLQLSFDGGGVISTHNR